MFKTVFVIAVAYLKSWKERCLAPFSSCSGWVQVPFPGKGSLPQTVGYPAGRMLMGSHTTAEKSLKRCWDLWEKDQLFFMSLKAR